MTGQWGLFHAIGSHQEGVGETKPQPLNEVGKTT